jgi:hypothetical protein
MPSRRHSHATNAAAKANVSVSSSRLGARNRDRRSTGNRSQQSSIAAASARRHRIDSLYAAEQEAAADALWRLDLGGTGVALTRAEERAASAGFDSAVGDANAGAGSASAEPPPAFAGGHSVSDGIERSRAAEIASARERVAEFAAVARQQRHAPFDSPLVGVRERFRRGLDRSLDLGLDSASLRADRALERLPADRSSRGGRAALDSHASGDPLSPAVAQPLAAGSDDDADLASPLLSPVSSSSSLPPNRASHAGDDVAELFDASELELFDMGIAAPSLRIPPRIPTASVAAFDHVPSSSSPPSEVAFSAGDAVSVDASQSLGLSLPAWAIDVISVSKSE